MNNRLMLFLVLAWTSVPALAQTDVRAGEADVAPFYTVAEYDPDCGP